MKTINYKSSLAILLTLVTFSDINVYAQDAKQIVDKFNTTMKVSGVEGIATLSIVDSKGRKRVRKISQARKLYDNGNTEKSIIKFLEPADVKGTGLLTYSYEKKDDDIWLYLPALRKTRRIVSSEKASSFMGSEFSYADIIAPDIDDFGYKLLGSEDINGAECWKIEIIPNTEDVADENGFSKKIVFIAKKNYVIRKAVYYDLDSELHKTMTVKSIKMLDEKNQRYVLMHMEMINEQNGRGSSFVFSKILFSPNIKDEYFTTTYLER
jgi:hypothetical protein